MTFTFERRCTNTRWEQHVLNSRPSLEKLSVICFNSSVCVCVCVCVISEEVCVCEYVGGVLVRVSV